jgi:hypothetical protein
VCRQQQQCGEDNRHCFLLQISFRPVYGGTIPNGAHKKLPRLVNAIPLGAGRLSQAQATDIQWRLVEGANTDLWTFLSVPMGWQEANESRMALKDRLVKQAKQVFGEVTVKSNVILSQCVHFDADFYINDIAESLEAGLHFHD